MSYWTYISGTMTVSSPGYFRNQEALAKYVNYAVEEVRKRSGEITGSEGPASIFVNTWHWPRSYGPTGEGYETAFITIQGSLRDRLENQTEKEFIRFFRKLNQYVNIDDVIVQIRGGTTKIFSSRRVTSKNTQIEFICDPDEDYGDDICFDEKEDDPQADKRWRIRHINHEKYIRSLLTEEKMYDIKWILDQMPFELFDKVLEDDYKLADYSFDIDALRRRRDRKMPLSREFLQYLEDSERDERGES